MEANGFIIKGWDGSENISDTKSIIDSLNRFISLNLGSKQGKKITLIPLFEAEIYKQNIWDEFLNKLQKLTKKNPKNPSNKTKSSFNNTTAILFYTPEEIPRGDFPDSVYNQSRMLRNFFENTTYARTANYRNIIEKLKELIVEIKENKKKSLNEAIIDLANLKKKIPNSGKQSPISLKDLSEIYTYQSFHTRGTHANLREFANILESSNSDLSFLERFKEYYLTRQKHDIASVISNYPLRFGPLKILVIDDNPDEGVENDFKKIKGFLPEGTEIWVTEGKEYKKFLDDKKFLQDLYKGEAKLKLKQITNWKGNFQDADLFNKETEGNKKKFKFDYVIVDLLLGNYNEGNKIIRELVKLRDYLSYERAHFYILALSLSDDVDDITRSFEEGALGYVWKFNRIYHLPYLIGELEESRQEIKKGVGIAISHAKARNFEKVYHLPPRIQMKLRTEPLLPPAFIQGNSFHPFAEDVAKTWIKQMPKADLHYHLGGSMDENIIFYLAVNSLYHILSETNSNKIIDVCKSFDFNNLTNNSNPDFYDTFFKGNEIYEQIKKIKNGNLDNPNDDFNKFLTTEFGLPDRIKSYIDKNFDKPAEIYFDYLSWKHKMNKDDIITLFIVLVGLLEGRTIDEAKTFWRELKNKIEKLKPYFKCLNFDPPILRDGNEPCDKKKIKIEEIKKEVNLSNSALLSSLIRAPREAKSLKEMFRGDCFIGALHLQYYENIVACVWYLVEKSAEENIRYLEMRVAPSGYTKKGLTLYQAVQALIDSANLSSLYFYLFEHKFIWPNFIISLKRHKTPVERVQEIASAIVFRETEFEHLRKKIKTNSAFRSTLYEWQPSKVVAVDLTGYEKGYPPSEFLEDFSPIFKVCSYITIHAGEEEAPQAIWEAIFKLNANRIGHGLTIHEFKELMNLARDTQICIELCPSSNILTNFKNNREKYPLFKYMKEGLNVTINTDDRGTLGTTLSDEFVEAAKLYYLSMDNESKIPLTKWETLRLIKAGFDNAFINREEKRKLLRWVEEEIYEKILQLYEIEPLYQVDKNF